MTFTCPAGHESSTSDYCDTCGAPIAGAAPAAPSAPPATASGATVTPAVPAAPAATCPNCAAPRHPDDAFCEVCGLDYATGRLPAPPPPPEPAPEPAPEPSSAPPSEPPDWMAVVEADRAFYETNQPEGSAGPIVFPEDLPPKEVPLRGDEILIGRRSDSHGSFPEIDLRELLDDPAVSRRHAVLRRTPDGWVVIDQGSTNGTRVKDAATAIRPGEPAALGDGDHVHVGAWTRITLRRTGTPSG